VYLVSGRDLNRGPPNTVQGVDSRDGRFTETSEAEEGRCVFCEVWMPLPTNSPAGLPVLL
jgi:hypothetical protein